MGFANKTTNLFNNKTTGEAPQLSSTYAEYDDGANVFNFYNNFAGTTVPSFINTSTSPITVTANNGLKLYSSGGNTYAWVMTSITETSPFIYEAFSNDSNGNNNDQLGLVIDSSTSSSTEDSGTGPSNGQYWVRWLSSGAGIIYENTGLTSISSPGLPSSTSGFLQQAIQNSTSVAYTIPNEFSIDASTTSSTNGYIGFYIGSGDSANTYIIHWARAVDIKGNVI